MDFQLQELHNKMELWNVNRSLQQMARAIVNAHDLLIETRIIKEYLKVQVTGDLKKGVIARCYF